MNSNTLLVLLLFSLSHFDLKSQDQKTDSLLQKLESVDEQDKAAVYNQLARFGTKNNPQKKIDYATKAFDIARKLQQQEQEYKALEQIATGYAYLGNNPKALEHDLKALVIAKIIQNDTFLSNAYFNLGYDYYYIGNLEKSLEYNLESLKIKTRMLEAGTLKSEHSLAKPYNNIGSTYSLLKEFPKALEYHHKALEIRKKMSDSSGIASSLHNIGSVNEKQKNFEESLNYYQQSLAISNKLGNKRDIAQTLNNIGNIQKATGDLDKALLSFNKALEYFTDSNNKGGRAATENNIAKIYILKKKPNKAYPMLLSGIKLAKETGQKKTLSEIYANLVDYYMLIEDYKNASLVQNKYILLKDTLYNQNLIDKVSEMQVKYEIEKKEKEIEVLARDKEIQSLKIKKQSVQMYFLFAFIFLALIISILVFSRFRLKQKNVRTELEKKNIETEQRLLRSQMNPHFIFNSMNSIQSFISGNDSFTAMTYLSKFAQLMRNILENSRKPFINLSTEINTLELYIELERIRFKNKFDFRITIDPELSVERVYIPPMLIQPFVENSIKHGLRNKPGNGLLEINFSQNSKYINCVIKDNGIGRKKAMELTKEKTKSHQSLGMHVTRERLNALSKEKGIDMDFEITDLKDKNGNAEGTQVMIQMPFEMD